MADNQRKQLVWLAALLVALAAVVAWQFWPRASAAPADTAAARTGAAAADARRGRPAGGAATVGPPPHVNLDALEARRADPTLAARNPFRLQASVPPSSPVAQPVPVAPPGGGAAGSGPGGPDAPPPPPPPISLKFIGTVAPSSGPAGKIAVLSDGKYVYYGREGDIIEGRYRLVKIGEESLQIEYVDGRGRQTLRLSGA
jgi:hypothetical protein